MIEKIRSEFDTMFDSITEAMGEFDSTLEQMEEYDINSIHSVEDFVAEMKKDGVYSDEIEEFIAHYLKYHNK